SERHLLSFTFRDSPVDFINVTCWGGEMYIQETSDMFHIGDIVEMSNFNVQSKPNDGSDERFRPWTSSLYQISLSENKSILRLYAGWDGHQYNSLVHIPVKASNDFLYVQDVLNDVNHVQPSDNLISLLVAVQQVLKDVTTRAGKQMKRCEVLLFDETAFKLPLVLWDQEMSQLAQSWTPKETVLFIADVRVSFNDYKKCVVASASSKTVITVNPETREAHALYQYAQTADVPLEYSSDFQENQAMDRIITNVFTTRDMKNMTSSGHVDGGWTYGIVFAFVSALDIDTQNPQLACFNKVETSTGCCLNQDCPQGSTMNLDASSTSNACSFDLRIHLSDQYGTLSPCHVYGPIAEEMLGLKVADYLNLCEDQKTELKWNFLLERCKVYLKVSLPDAIRPRISYRVMNCTLADPLEYVNYL
ncbi:hypothetical protein CAPTEDRAFT_89352, partial [Capitella teleta]